MDLETLKMQHFEMFTSKREAFCRHLFEAYREYYAGADTSVSDAELFSCFYLWEMSRYPFEVYSGEALVGTGWHFNWRWSHPDDIIRFPHNIGHYIADFAGLLAVGIGGKRLEIKNFVPTDDIGRRNKQAFCTALDAFVLYCLGYADAAEKAGMTKIAADCRFISEKPPVSLRQALQLVLLLQFFLQIEASAAAMSLGRADQYLYSYYEHDLKSGVLTEKEALELIECFYIKLSEGDESQMLTVGGPRENALSILFVRAQETIHMRQPSVAIRVCETTSRALMEAGTALTLTGGGMPAWFCDDVVIRGLRSIGIDKSSAEDYGIVGCYEASPQGIYSNTVAMQLYLYDAFSAFLQEKVEYLSYDEFYTGFEAFFRNYYQQIWMPALHKALSALRSTASPFASVCMKGCIDSGRLCEENGSNYFLLGMNILGIGLVVDSLYVVKKLVFDYHSVTLDALRRAAEDNFSDEAIYALVKNLPGAYGSNGEQSNSIAHSFSIFLRSVIDANPIGGGVILSPALFWFTADIRQQQADANLCGRRKGELLSYGIAPCVTPHHYPVLDVLSSASHVASDLFPDGCPVMLSLSREEIEAAGVFEAVLRGYFAKGGFHLAVNVNIPETLEAAKTSPEAYPDIMVKISGLSTRFTSLDDQLQNAIIERAKQGM